MRVNAAGGGVLIGGDNMRITTISAEVYKGGQDLKYNEVLSFVLGTKKHKLRVSICSDSYRGQCYARIKRWSGSTWQLVHSIDDMKTGSKLVYHNPTPGPEAFEADRKELIRVAERVLS